MDTEQLFAARGMVFGVAIGLAMWLGIACAADTLYHYTTDIPWRTAHVWLAGSLPG